MPRKISKNFTAAENRCRCGECDKFGADVQLVEVMQELRDHFGSKVIVHSWYRCRAHNNRPKNEKSRFGVFGAGSNDNSWHPTGAAIDFHVSGVANDMVHWYLRKTYPKQFGVGIYDWGIHLDMSTERRDWDERTTSTGH